MTDDILDRAAPFLNQCPSCDAGLPKACTCPEGDFRPVMLDLVLEVERLQNRLKPRQSGGCPCCGGDIPLGGYGVCVPCAAEMGWDPPCAACKAEDSGEPSGALRHAETCGPGRSGLRIAVATKTEEKS